MAEENSTGSPGTNIPMTKAQIIAATVGPPQPLNSPIYLAPYDPDWPALFTQLKQQIQAALGDAIQLLEHVGSTSVPGLSAKPITDLIGIQPETIVPSVGGSGLLLEKVRDEQDQASPSAR